MRRQRGFFLVELAVTLVIFAVLLVAMIGWQVNEYKHAKAKELVGTLLALDAAFYQVQSIVSYLPVPANLNITTSPQSDTPFVCILKNTDSWKNYVQVSNDLLSVLPKNVLDPKVDIKNLARQGYKFTFNVSNNKLNSITLSGIDNDMNNLIANMLVGKWDRNTRTYILNNGNGYELRFNNSIICGG